jgi:predicted methyltransferase
MRRSVILAVSAALVLSAGGVALARQAAPSPATYAAALADPVRTAEDRARDEARHTAGTLAFAGVRPGWKVADMIMGGGYFTRVFSAAVGPEGHVTAWQPEEFVAFGANYGAAVAAADAIANVDGVRAPLGAAELGSDLDLVFTAQNYHDLHLKAFPADTAAKVNAAAFAALKPGGVYVIIDHAAAAGTGLEAADTLHRIDAEAVKAEVEAAGFVLDGESEVLANPDDPRGASVFDPSIRGRTSQFMLRFRKPA